MNYANLSKYILWDLTFGMILFNRQHDVLVEFYRCNDTTGSKRSWVNNNNNDESKP